jgi:hypothetical protein
MTAIARFSGFFAAAVASAPNPISIFAVARNDQDAAFRLRQSQSQSDCDRAPHRTPEIKIERMVTHSRAVIGWRAETRHHQRVAAIGQYSGDGAAAQQLALFVHRFSP